MAGGLTDTGDPLNEPSASVLSEPFDVLVMGAGLAGSVAAVRARQEGARVLLLERAPDATSAGNTRLSGGSLHAAGGHLDDAAEEIAVRIDRVTDGGADPDLRDAFAGSAGHAFRWLTDQGVGFEPRDPRHGFRFLAPRRDLACAADWPGRGPQLALATLQRRFRRSGGVLATSATVEDLRLSSRRTVTGARIVHRGRRHEVRAGAVVLCDGGFQGNTALLDQYVGPHASRATLRGSTSGQGDALRLGIGVGADITRMSYFYGHLLHRDSATDERLSPLPTLDSLLIGGVVVDGGGTSMAPGQENGIAMANTLARSPDPTGAWLVVDDALWRAEQQDSAGRVVPPPVRLLLERGGRAVAADSVDELARQMTVSAESLSRSLADHLPRWRLPLHAVPVTPGITFTMGGLRIDALARVRGAEGEPIHALYAAGGTAGGLQGSADGGYVGGLAPALVFGMIAGRNAVRPVPATGEAA